MNPIEAAGAAQAGAAAATPAKPEGRLVKAAQDFASMLWEEVLHTALPTGTLMGDSSGAGDVYGGLVESGLADVMGRGPGGLSKLVLESLTRTPSGGGATPPKVSDP